MALTVSSTARKYLQAAQPVTTAGINAVGAQTIAIAGTLDTNQITDDAITPAKLEYGAFFWASTGGTANAITLTTGNSLSGMPETGEVVAFKADSTNTGAVDVTVDSYSSANLYKHGGTELVRDDLRSGQVYVIRFDGTNWQLLDNRGQPDFVTGTDAGSTDDYAFDADPAISAYRSGQLFVFYANTAGQPGATLNVNSLGTKTIKKQKDQDIALGDIKAGQWVACVYDGTNMQLTSPVSNVQAPGIPGTNQGLTVTVASTATITVTADWLAVTDSSGNAVVLENVSETLNISTTPPAQNALDTSTTEATSTGYWIYVCYDQASDTAFGLFSTNSSAPATNVAYTHWAKVGWVYNDSGSDFAQSASYRQGRWYFTSATLTANASSAETFAISHPFGVTPFASRAVLVCQATDNGYAAGDEVPYETARETASSTLAPFLGLTSDTLTIDLEQRQALSGATGSLANKTGTTVGNLGAGDWKWKLYAEF